MTIFIQNCAEPEDNDTVEESAYENTLTNQTIGDGSTGAIDDIFLILMMQSMQNSLDIQNQGSVLLMIST